MPDKEGSTPIKEEAPKELENIPYLISPGEIIISLKRGGEDHLEFNIYRNIDNEDGHSLARAALAYGLTVYAAQNPDTLCELAFNSIGGETQGSA